MTIDPAEAQRRRAARRRRLQQRQTLIFGILITALLAVALLAALLIGDERSQQMWKTVLVVQPNRVAVLTGKVVVCMLALLALMAGAFVSSVVFGAIGTAFLPTAFDGEWLRLIGLYLLQWAHLLAPVLLAFLLVFVVRSAVLGIVMVLFLPGLIEGVYTVLNTLLQLQPLNRINAIFQTLRLRQAWEEAPRYFFTANLYAPARSPTNDMVTDFMTATNELEQGAAAPETRSGGYAGLVTLLFPAGQPIRADVTKVSTARSARRATLK